MEKSEMRMIRREYINYFLQLDYPVHSIKALTRTREFRAFGQELKAYA